MKTFHGSLGSWIALTITILICLGCSQSSSQLPPSQAQPSTDSEVVVGGEEVTGKPDLQAPSGEKNDHLIVRVNRQQYSDANLLIPLKGEVLSQSGVPIELARWSQVSGPAATILRPTEPETLALMPNVSEPTQLAFRLYGVNVNDYVNADTAYVLVQPPADDASAQVIGAARNEEDGSIEFTVALSKAANVPISVPFRTVDGTAIAEADYIPRDGILVFEPGEILKEVVVDLIADDQPEDNEYFMLSVNGIIPSEADGDERVNASGVGVIIDHINDTSFPTTQPEIEGPADAEQVQLSGSAGVIRINLQWTDPEDNLNLIVLDPCGEQALSVDLPQVECLGDVGRLEVGEESSWENAFWAEYAPPGLYNVRVEHREGYPADYVARIYVGEQNYLLRGTVANGDTVELMTFEHTGEGGSSNESSASSSTTSSSSIISSSVSTSSEESTSSTSSTSSSSISSESSVSSSVSSVSSASSSVAESSVSISTSSSSSVSSSTASSVSSYTPEEGAPQVALSIEQGQELYSRTLSISGQISVTSPIAVPVAITMFVTVDGDLQELLVGVLNFTGTEQFSEEVDLSPLDLPDGRYEFYLAAEALGLEGRSTVQEFVLVTPETLVINIESPQPDGVYYQPVEVSGSISVDPALTPEATVELVLNEQAEAEPIQIPVDEQTNFSWLVSEPGSYTLNVEVSDSTQSASESINFVYIAPDVNVALTAEAPLNEQERHEVVDALPLSFAVESNITFVPELIELVFSAEDEEVLRVNVSPDLWDSTAQSVSDVVAVADLELPFGDYDVQVEVVEANGLTFASNSLPIHYREAQPLELTLNDLAADTLFEAVVLTGQVAVDPLRTLDLQATLENLGEETGPLEVNVLRDGEDFSYTVDQPGTYAFRVTATDGYTEQSGSAEFTYTAPEAAVSLDHDMPVLEDGAIDTLGQLQLIGRVTTNNLQLLNDLVLEYQLGEGQWETLVDVGLGENFDGEIAQVNHQFDADFAYGTYNVRLRLNYGDGLSVTSAALPVVYREARPVSIQLNSPAAEAIYYWPAPVEISGVVEGEPALPFTLSATLDNLGDDEPAQPVDITSDDRTFTGVIEAPGEYQLAIVASDAYSEDTLTVSFSYLEPTASIGVEPQHPSNTDGVYDVTGDLQLSVFIEAIGEPSFDELVLETNNDGEWEVYQVYPFDEVWNEDEQRVDLTYNLADEGRAFGEYEMRVTLHYAGAFIARDGFTAEYRAYIDPTIESISPDQETIAYSPIDVVVSVNADPTASLQVTGVLSDEEDAEFSEEVTFTAQGDGSYSYRIERPAYYQLSVSVEDANTGASPDATSDVFLAYIEPQIDLFLSHDHPLDEQDVVDLYEPLWLEVGVENNTLTSPVAFRLIALSDGEETILREYPAQEVLDGTSGYLEFDFTQEELTEGTYSLQVIGLFEEELTARSEPLLVNYRVLEPLVVRMLEPLQDSSHVRPVAVRGEVSSDPSLPYVLSGQLTNLDSGASRVLELNSAEGEFSAVVDDIGEFRLTVEAQDGVRSVSETVQFSHQIATLDVTTDHSHRVLEDGALDIIGLVEISINVVNEAQYPIERAVLELQTDSGWTEIEVAAVTQGEDGDRFIAQLDLAQADWQLGRYVIRARVDYLNDQTSTSAPLEIVYRAVQAPRFVQVDSPRQGLNTGEGLRIAGTYELDPLAEVSSLSATLYFESGSSLLNQLTFGPFPISAVDGQFDEVVDDSSIVAANRVELVLRDTLGGNDSWGTSLNYIPSSLLVVQVLEPESEIYQTARPEVPIVANVYVAEELRPEVYVRILSSAGEEILREAVANLENWNLDDNGRLQGSLNFAQLEDGRYRVEVAAQYASSLLSATDFFIVDYAAPDLPIISLLQPVAGSTHDDEVLISGEVFADDLGLESITGVFASLDRVGDDSTIVNARIPLNLDGGVFGGELSNNLLNQAGEYVLNVWAEDTLGRQSPAESVRFSVEPVVSLPEVVFISPQNSEPFTVENDLPLALVEIVNWDESMRVNASVNGVSLDSSAFNHSNQQVQLPMPLTALRANSSNQLTVSVFDENNQQIIERSLVFETRGAGGTLAEGADVVVFNDGNAFLRRYTQNLVFFENLLEFGSDEYKSERSIVYFDNRWERECGEADQCGQAALTFQELAAQNAMRLAQYTGGDFYTDIPRAVRVIIIFGMNQGLAAEQIDGLRRFVLQGGRLVIIGDHPASSMGTPATYNSIFQRLGISVRNIDLNGATGNETLVANPLANHRLLTGVEEVYIGGGGATTYGDGALPLFIANRGPVGLVAKITNVTAAEVVDLGDLINFDPVIRLSTSSGVSIPAP